MEDFSTVNIWGREDMKNLLKKRSAHPDERFERGVKSEVIFKASPSRNSSTNAQISIFSFAPMPNFHRDLTYESKGKRRR